MGHFILKAEEGEEGIKFPGVGRDEYSLRALSLYAIGTVGGRGGLAERA